ncbi:MAG: cation transporter [Defluviitaleaceae bacterium]|nr:cation transporter [Defluviitaleaceae bacterium]
MTTVLKVGGMSCSHCTNAITTALSAIAGVSAVHVSLEKKEVHVNHTDETVIDNLYKSIDELGFDILY